MQDTNGALDVLGNILVVKDQLASRLFLGWKRTFSMVNFDMASCATISRI